MNTKGILYNMGGWSQLFFFCFLAFSGLMLTALVVVSCMSAEEMQSSAHNIRLAQTIQGICLFILPALAFAHLCEEKPLIYLKANADKDIQLLLLTILLIISLQPLINFISYYNQQIVLPESLASIETWMKESENSIKKTIDILFTDKSMMGLVSNLLVIAVVAGLAEELFFRGVLQQVMQKIVINKHATVWITAFIFSAIHFQFYGFFPRIMMGAVLGYLFIWSNNIWVPVIAHTIHNAVNVIIAFTLYGSSEYEKIEHLGTSNNFWIVILSLIISTVITIIIYRKRITAT